MERKPVGYQHGRAGGSGPAGRRPRARTGARRHRLRRRHRILSAIARCRLWMCVCAANCCSAPAATLAAYEDLLQKALFWVVQVACVLRATGRAALAVRLVRGLVLIDNAS